MKKNAFGSRERGSALIISILLMLFLGGLAATLLVVQFHRDRLKNDYIEKLVAFHGAEGALNFASERIWTAFLQSNGGQPGKLFELQAFLDKNAIASIPEGQWTQVPMGLFDLGGNAAAAVEVLRTDTVKYTELRYRTSATVNGHTETIEAAFRAENDTYNGFQFALFSNNVSCTFCHAKIDSVKKFSGAPYERVRVATLESLMVRSSAESTIAGTLYTQGKLMDKSGVVLADLAATTLDAYKVTNGLIDPASKVLLDLTAAPVDADGKPVPGYNLYKDYPEDPVNQTDGKLPTDFPPVFPDDNGNRVVDDDEFKSIAATASGSASGFGFVVPNGSSYGGSTVLTSTAVNLQGSVDGNLILTGTAANPIKIDGDVVVNGDVIIQGVVQGLGSIKARGNVYVTGDLVYNDAVSGGTRTYGVAPDGTTNGLGLAAGGNVLVGDYLTPKGGSVTSTTSLMTGKSTDGFGFTLSQISLFNRREWQITQPFLPNSSGVMVPNSTYDPTYVPKYYAVGAGTPVWNYVSGVTWDPVNKTWIGSEHAGSFKAMTELKPGAGAVVSTLNPTNPWLTATQLKQFWIEDESKRSSGAPIRIDSLIYTDSSVFTLARKASKSGGKLTLNGALVARDTGVLVPTNLELNYDERVTEFLDLQESTAVTLYRAYHVRRTLQLAQAE